MRGVRGSGRLQAELGRRAGEVQRHFCGSELLPSCQLTRHSSQTPYGLYANGLRREGSGERECTTGTLWRYVFDFRRVLTGVYVVAVGHSGPYTPDSQPMGGYMLDGQAHMAARASGDIFSAHYCTVHTFKGAVCNV